MTDSTECTFWDPKTRHIAVVKIKVTTTLDAKMLALRNACQDHCRKTASPAWVQPAAVRGSDKWLGFRMEGSNAHYVQPFPSREAAEMWLICRNGA